MTLKYSIKDGADPENPNEQLPGRTIKDGRLFGHDVAFITYGCQCYTPDEFQKRIDSNTLTLTSEGASFPSGKYVIIQTVSTT